MLEQHALQLQALLSEQNSSPPAELDNINNIRSYIYIHAEKQKTDKKYSVIKNNV